MEKIKIHCRIKEEKKGKRAQKCTDVSHFLFFRPLYKWPSFADTDKQQMKRIKTDKQVKRKPLASLIVDVKSAKTKQKQNVEEIKRITTDEKGNTNAEQYKKATHQ